MASVGACPLPTPGPEYSLDFETTLKDIQPHLHRSFTLLPPRTLPPFPLANTHEPTRTLSARTAHA